MNTRSSGARLLVVGARLNRSLRPARIRDATGNSIPEQSVESNETAAENLGEQGPSHIGRALYEAHSQDYRAKQWQTEVSGLPPSISARLSVRCTYDSRSFNDAHGGLPADGWTAWREPMTDQPRNEVRFGIDFFDGSRERHQGSVVDDFPVDYTGSIDRHFGYSAARLGTPYLEERILDTGDGQGCSVMKHDADAPYRRIRKSRHVHRKRDWCPLDKTVILRNYSRLAERQDEPYYPIDTSPERKRLVAYPSPAGGEDNALFGAGRGAYTCLDKYMVLGSAFSKVDNRLS